MDEDEEVLKDKTMIGQPAKAAVDGVQRSQGSSLIIIKVPANSKTSLKIPTRLVQRSQGPSQSIIRLPADSRSSLNTAKSPVHSLRTGSLLKNPGQLSRMPRSFLNGTEDSVMRSRGQSSRIAKTVENSVSPVIIGGQRSRIAKESEKSEPPLVLEDLSPRATVLFKSVLSQSRWNSSSWIHPSLFRSTSVPRIVHIVRSGYTE